MPHVWKAGEKRERLRQRQRNRCHWCHEQMNSKPFDPKQVTLDHLIPRAHGGGGSIGNLVAACRECNEERGKKLNDEIMSRQSLAAKTIPDPSPWTIGLTMKTLEENFTDWELNAFGFGYGTGEKYTILALKTFFGAIGRDDSQSAYDYEVLERYDYEVLERAVTPTVAWLLINILCRADIIEYGTSPRYGWLTPHGEKLKAFIDSKTPDELLVLTQRDHNYVHCYPDACNCGEEGYQEGVKCQNPFWQNRT